MRCQAEQATSCSTTWPYDVLQFLTLNLHEFSAFHAAEQRSTMQGLVEVYNRIVDECETDPGLRIVLNM